jgi:hypothetical protein
VAQAHEAFGDSMEEYLCGTVALSAMHLYTGIVDWYILSTKNADAGLLVSYIHHLATNDHAQVSIGKAANCFHI